MFIHDADVTVRDAACGEIIRELTIDPTRDYQSIQRKTPRSEDRGVTDDPDTSVKDVSTHHIVELRGFEPLTSSMRTKRSTN